jgi:hypothetical protein
MIHATAKFNQATSAPAGRQSKFTVRARKRLHPRLDAPPKEYSRIVANEDIRISGPWVTVRRPWHLSTAKVFLHDRAVSTKRGRFFK